MLGGQRQEEGDAQDAVQRRRSENFSRRERRKRRGRGRRRGRRREGLRARRDTCGRVLELPFWAAGHGCGQEKRIVWDGRERALVFEKILNIY